MYFEVVQWFFFFKELAYLEIILILDSEGF